jgi:hypothetical protein
VVVVDRQAVSIVQDATPHIVGTRLSLSAFCVLTLSLGCYYSLPPSLFMGAPMDPTTQVGFISNEETFVDK